MMSEHWGIKDPVRLFAEPIADDNWRLVAEDAQGNRLTIVASRERFSDALLPRGFRRMSEVEQVREMFIRDEVGIRELEQAIERSLR